MNNNSDTRNLMRNIVLKAASKQFAGNQRITTGRDSMAFNESTGTHKPVVYNSIILNGIVGYAQAGE